MTVTAKLLRVYRVDQQLRGLTSRLDSAERFLSEQQRQLTELDARFAALSEQVKKSKASISGDEHEAQAVDARMAQLREQMNAARTNKEYSAFLAEVNTLKTKKDEFEKHQLEVMESLQGAEKELAELAAKRDERIKVRDRAKAERDERAAEIKGRVEELTAQRETLAADVPKDAMKTYTDLSRLRGDEAMAQVEVLDHKAHEYTCSSCQMALPVETLNHVVKGNFVRCSACQCILFSAEELEVHKKPAPGGKKKGKKEAEV
jgi:predicted  nucleic acid-binding Zn-ribbon protein